MTLGEGGPGVSVSGSYDFKSRSTAASAYDDEKGWHTTSGSRSQSGSGGGNVGTTAGYGIVGGSGAGFSYEFSLNSTSGPSGTSSTSGSASATLSWSGTGDTGQTGSGITARARYGDGEGWQIVSVGPATTAEPEGVPGAGDLGTAAAGDDATFSGDESSRQGQAAANGKGDTAAGDVQGQATSSTLDRVQLGLDVLGLVPVLGEAFDGLNGLISWGRGDYSGAALSFAGMLPVGGQAATAAKLGLKYGDDVAAVAAKARRAVADTVSGTQNAALRTAKEANGIPRSAQPSRTIKPNTPEGIALGLDDRNVVMYEYINSSGQKIHIRLDKPAPHGSPGSAGSQGWHFNAGPAGTKLKQHHYFPGG